MRTADLHLRPLLFSGCNLRKGAAPALSRACPAIWAQDAIIQLSFPHACAQPLMWTSAIVICTTLLVLGFRTYWLLLPVCYPLLSSQPGFSEELSSHPHCPCLSQPAASGDSLLPSPTCSLLLPWGTGDLHGVMSRRPLQFLICSRNSRPVSTL